MTQPDPAPTTADLAAAEALYADFQRSGYSCRADFWRPLIDRIAAALSRRADEARREGREAGLAQAAERVRWLAGIHRGVGGELHLKCEALLLALAHDITALPPPGEG